MGETKVKIKDCIIDSLERQDYEDCMKEEII